MRAAFYTRLGPPGEVLVLGDLPRPEPGPGEIRGNLRTSGANPSDWKARSGARGGGMSFPLIVPHSDGAGEIDALGQGVDRQLGERVWIWNGQFRRPLGTAAEYIVIPSRQAPPLPEGVGVIEGACLGIPAFTALQAVRLARLEPGMTVLVVGGAGSVAGYAIQLAKMRGVTVVATVSGPAKADRAAETGADIVLNYREEDIAERVRSITGGSGVDRVLELDLAANASGYPDIVAPHGHVVVYGTSHSDVTIPALRLMRASISLEPFLVYEIPDNDRSSGIAEINELLAHGRLHHKIGRVLPLSEIAKAHALGEANEVIGNIVIEL